MIRFEPSSEPKKQCNQWLEKSPKWHGSGHCLRLAATACHCLPLNASLYRRHSWRVIHQILQNPLRSQYGSGRALSALMKPTLQLVCRTNAKLLYFQCWPRIRSQSVQKAFLLRTKLKDINFVLIIISFGFNLFVKFQSNAYRVTANDKI